MNPLTHCLERLHLGDNTKLLDRAQQFQSQCATKVPVRVFKGPNSQHVISIQLAYESLGLYDWNSKLAPELAGCSPKAYNTSISAVRKHLNLQSTITFDTLGVTFGSTAMATHARDLWTTFVQQHIAQLGPAQQVSAQNQLASALWKGAAFYVCGRAVGVQIDKSKLLTLCTCDSVEFKKSAKLIQQECKSEIKKLKTQSSPSSRSSRKRKSTTETTEKDDDNKEDKNEDEQDEQDGQDESKATKKKSSKKEQSSSRKKTKTTPTKLSTESTTTTTTTATTATITATTGTTKLPSIPRQKSVLLKKAPTKKRGAVSGIVSMINLQDYRTSKKYKDYLQWERQMKQKLSKARS